VRDLSNGGVLFYREVVADYSGGVWGLVQEESPYGGVGVPERPIAGQESGHYHLRWAGRLPERGTSEGKKLTTAPLKVLVTDVFSTPP